MSKYVAFRAGDLDALTKTLVERLHAEARRSNFGSMALRSRRGRSYRRSATSSAKTLRV
jgi:hypothetical protein